MKVREIMRRDPRTVDRDDPAIHALQQMLWTGIRHLPVLHEGKLVGVVSERDLLASRSDRERLYGDDGDRVGDVMSTPTRVTYPNAEVADAAAEMSVNKVGCLPVVDAGRVVGLVTTTDLLAAEAWLPVELTRGESTTASELMSRHLRAVNATDHLLDAAAEMTQRGVRHLPVVDGIGRVIGILSDRDIREVIGDLTVTTPENVTERLLALRVSDAMTAEPYTLDEDTPLPEVVRALVTDHVGALPVVDAEGVLTGMVSYVDVLRALAGAPARASLRARSRRPRGGRLPPA